MPTLPAAPGDGPAPTPYLIPGWAIDLITDGVRAKDPHALPNEVTRAVRSVMMSAHKRGTDWTYLRGLLTDDGGRRLAAQIVAAHGGRGRSLTLRNRFLADHWQDTARVVAKGADWTHADILGFVHFVAWQLQQDTTLSARDRTVVTVAVEEALRNRMMRPVITTRTVAARLGCSPDTAHRALAAVAKVGYWLATATKGRPSADPAKRKGSTFHLGPRLRPEYLSYIGHFPLPMSGLPMSDPTKGAEAVQITVTTTTTTARIITAPSAEVAYRLMRDAVDDDEARMAEQVRAEAPRLRVVRQGETA